MCYQTKDVVDAMQKDSRVRIKSLKVDGGAAASVGLVKQRRIIFAARHYLMRRPGSLPPCRFDVVGVEEGQIQWLRAAFMEQ